MTTNSRGLRSNLFGFVTEKGIVWFNIKNNKYFLEKYKENENE